MELALFGFHDFPVESFVPLTWATSEYLGRHGALAETMNCPAEKCVVNKGCEIKVFRVSQARDT